jgi:hypothetical protein
MPYLLVAQVAVVWLVVQFARSPDASKRTKRLVVALAIASFLTLCFWPAMMIPAALVQITICICLILRPLVLAWNDER